MSAKPRVAGPDVIAYAEKVKLDLTQVQGTGTNNTITRADAERALWERVRPKMAAKMSLDPSASWAEIKGALDAWLRPRAVAAGLDPTATLPEIQTAEKAQDAERARERTEQSASRPVAGSFSSHSGRVAGRGPAYALNALVDQVRAQASAQQVPAPSAPAPTLFASGDLPSFTASGIPPETLLDAPWEARHAMAAAPTTADAYAVLNAATGAPAGDYDAAYDFDIHPGNADYRARVQQWRESAITNEQREAAFAQDMLGARVIEYERKSGLNPDDIPTSPAVGI